jgi:hypothetical protein
MMKKTKKTLNFKIGIKTEEQNTEMKKFYILTIGKKSGNEKKIEDKKDEHQEEVEAKRNL